VTPTSPARASYREVLGDREFGTMFVAGGLAVVGDQLARIAVALLVFERSGSALAASATYACSYLTWLLGGPVLSALSDRHSRRRLMITVDLVRMVLIALLVIPGVPLWLVFVVLTVVGLLSPPFEAARSALLADVLHGDAYVMGNALTQTVNQAAQVVGFVGGGALVALLSTEGALLANAATFGLSALLIFFGVTERGRQPLASTAPLLSEAAEGARLVLRSPALRGLLSWGLLSAAVVIAPEGLAVAIADESGGGALVAGILTAAVPAGFLLGSFLLIRLPQSQRERLFVPLVLLSVGMLVLTPLLDSLVLLTIAWVIAGVGNALQLIANAAFVQAVPAHLRGRAYGVAGTALAVIQGVVLLAAGALAEVTGPRVPVAVMAVLGLLCLPGVIRAGRDNAQGDPTECRVATR
jgi:MFS family permease